MDERILLYRGKVAPNDSISFEAYTNDLDFKKADKFSYLEPSKIAVVLLEEAYLSNQKSQEYYSEK